MRTHLAIKRIKHVVLNEIYINIILLFQFPTPLDTAYSVLLTRNVSGKKLDEIHQNTIIRNFENCLDFEFTQDTPYLMGEL